MQITKTIALLLAGVAGAIFFGPEAGSEQMAIILPLLGGIAGALDSTETTSTSRIDMEDPGFMENYLYGIEGVDDGTGVIADRYMELEDMVDAGPGQSDVTASLNATRGFADMLGDYSQSGGLPSEADITQSQGLAAGLFNARRTALDHSFEDQNLQFQRLAAQTGRSPTDPVFQNMMRRDQTRQQDMIMAQQTDFGNAFALDLPGRRLDFAGRRADVLSGLAGQAMRNRATLISMGDQLGSREREFRLRSGTQVQTGETSRNPIAGAISGGIAGLAAGVDMASSLAGSFMPGGGGGGGGGGGTRQVAQALPVAPAAPAPVSSSPLGGAAPGIMGFSQGIPASSGSYGGGASPMSFTSWMAAGRPKY